MSFQIPSVFTGSTIFDLSILFLSHYQYNTYLSILFLPVLFLPAKPIKAGMKASGVPKSVYMMKQLNQIEEDYNKNLEELSKKVDCALSGLPEKLKDTITKNFNVEGVVPMTKDDIMKVYQDCTVKDYRNLESIYKASLSKVDALANAIQSGGSFNGLRYNSEGRGSPNEDVRVFPQEGSFKFPTRLSCISIYHLMKNGHKEKKIVPYERILPVHCFDISAKNSLSHAKMITKWMDMKIGEKDRTDEKVLQSAYETILSEAYENTRKPADPNMTDFGTVYQRMMRTRREKGIRVKKVVKRKYEGRVGRPKGRRRLGKLFTNAPSSDIDGEDEISEKNSEEV